MREELERRLRSIEKSLNAIMNESLKQRKEIVSLKQAQLDLEKRIEKLEKVVL